MVQSKHNNCMHEVECGGLKNETKEPSSRERRTGPNHLSPYKSAFSIPLRQAALPVAHDAGLLRRVLPPPQPRERPARPVSKWALLHWRFMCVVGTITSTGGYTYVYFT